MSGLLTRCSKIFTEREGDTQPTLTANFRLPEEPNGGIGCLERCGQRLGRRRLVVLDIFADFFVVAQLRVLGVEGQQACQNRIIHMF